MKLYLVIWTFNAIRIDSFILKSSYNLQVNDGAQNEPDTKLKKEDFEMIDKQQLQRFDLGNKDKIFYYFNKLASKEYGKATRKSMSSFRRKDVKFIRQSIKTINRIKTTHSYSKSTHHVRKREEVEKTSETYDYDTFLIEYYEELLFEERFNKTYHPQAVESADLVHRLQRMAAQDSSQHGRGSVLAVFRKLFIDCKNEHCSKKEIVANAWTIIKIWLCFYLIVAVPLWSTKGWCCCCLCCKIFNPRRTIEKAKTYLIQNPPGILKTRKGQTLYEPTDEERESYKQFEHLIKII